MNAPSFCIEKIERVDDIPLLLAQMEKMQIAPLLDKHFPTHGNWRGLSIGNVVVGWLAYILSEGDHRMNSVQKWAASLLITLGICLKTPDVRELDFSDDRLCNVLDRLGEDDVARESYESEQTATLLRVYDMKARRIRIDSTTAKGYVGVSEGGLFQFGHSKDHRSDLPQLKINQAALDPLGLPLSTSTVIGNCADDPLYVPEIRKVQKMLGKNGLLYIGDSKLASNGNRAYIAASGDHYLAPLPAVQMPATKIRELLEPVWAGRQALCSVYRELESTRSNPEHIADGFAYSVMVEGEHDGQKIEWKERRLVVRSLKHAAAQKKALDARLAKAEREIAALNKRGRGHKDRNEEETRLAVKSVLERCNVDGLLNIEYKTTTQTTLKRAYKGQAAHETTTVHVLVASHINPRIYEETERCLGWRTYACNDLELDLNEAVLAYREQYIVERGFNRLKGKILGLTPLYLSSNTRIKGLIRLLCIGLRVLCLVEFTVREALQKKNEKLDKIYAGNPKRATAKPTTEMMLRAFKGINLVITNFDGIRQHHMTPLNAVQSRILSLLGLPEGMYSALGRQSWHLSIKMSEP